MELVTSYRVNLPEFEGPLDLLLYLIRKNDLDVYDIPISFITGEYLKTIDAMKELNIDLAGEFLAMAAELMLIKSRMLLPSTDTEEVEEGQDPREELARRLLEYQRFKMAASELNGRWFLGRDVFKRQILSIDECFFGYLKAHSKEALSRGYRRSHQHYRPHLSDPFTSERKRGDKPFRSFA